MSTNEICDDCKRRKAEQEARPGIVAIGGWVAPAGSVADFLDGGCYSFKPGPKPKRRGVKRAVWLLEMEEWRESLELEGQIIHAYPAPLHESFPTISATRGGMTYGVPPIEPDHDLIEYSRDWSGLITGVCVALIVLIFVWIAITQ